MDVDALTALLADRLVAIVPAGFGVRAGDGVLWYSAGEGSFPGQQGDCRVGRSGTHVRVNVGVYGDTDADNLVGLAVQALDELHPHPPSYESGRL